MKIFSFLGFGLFVKNGKFGMSKRKDLKFEIFPNNLAGFTDFTIRVAILVIEKK